MGVPPIPPATPALDKLGSKDGARPLLVREACLPARES